MYRDGYAGPPSPVGKWYVMPSDDLVVLVAAKSFHEILGARLAGGEAAVPTPEPKPSTPGGDYPSHWKMFSAREQDIINVLADGETRPAKEIAVLSKYDHSAYFDACLTNLCERNILVASRRGYSLVK